MAITATTKGTSLVELDSDPAGAVEAPTGATEGYPVKGVDSVGVVIEAASGQTLSNTGNLRAYHYDANSNSPAAWVRLPSEDIAVPAAPVSQRRLAFVKTISVKRGRITWRPDGVGVSAGNLTTYMMFYDPKLKDMYQ